MACQELTAPLAQNSRPRGAVGQDARPGGSLAAATRPVGGGLCRTFDLAPAEPGDRIQTFAGEDIQTFAGDNLLTFG